MIVPNWGMPQHIQKDGIRLFKMLHIQISLGKTASESKLQQQADEAGVGVLHYNVCPKSSSTNVSPTTHSPTCICSLIPTKTLSLFAPCKSSLSDCQACASPFNLHVFPPCGTAGESWPHVASQAAGLTSASPSSGSFSICKARFGRIALSNFIF